MKRLFDAADRYLKRCDWKDLALLKFCLFSMGVLLGSIVPRRGKKPARELAGAVFFTTYIPLMAKFFSVLLSESED